MIPLNLFAFVWFFLEATVMILIVSQDIPPLSLNPDTFSKRISFNVTHLLVPVVSGLLTCGENECFFYEFCDAMNYQRKLDVQRRYAWSLPLTYKPNFLLKVSFLHTIIIVICRCYLFRRSISSSKKQVKSIFFNDSSSKSRSTETFSFVTSIIGKNLRRT